MSIEAPPLERKLVAILAADVEGYSRMMHKDEVATLAVLSSHRTVIDALIASASGNITSTAGDSVLAEFASVLEAVQCAVAIQTELAAANARLPAEQHMHFRIGINVGDVMVKDGGIFGDGVNVAARVESLAPPGGICVTRGVRDHVRDRLPYKFEDSGDQAVKNIARPIHVFRLIFDKAELAEHEEPSVVLETSPSRPASPAEDDAEIEMVFWKSIESRDDADEYHAYLNRYPEGVFAELARTRITTLSEKPPGPVDRSVEMMFWSSIKDSGDARLFKAYLDRFPDGEFRPIAELLLAAAEDTPRS